MRANTLFSTLIVLLSFLDIDRSVASRFDFLCGLGLSRRSHGSDLVREMLKINQRAEKESWSLKTMLERGFFEPDAKQVYNFSKGVENTSDPLNYQIVRFPYAKTGAYLPKDISTTSPSDLEKIYDGYIILLPGIGTNQSNAASLFNIGLTLMKGSNPALEIGSTLKSRKIRLLPVLVDATLNGLNGEAPLAFGTRSASLGMVRTVHLFMKRLFPHGTAHIAGRSYGGTIANEYASIYGDLASSILINPSPSEHKLHFKGVFESEKNLDHMTIGGTRLVLNHSWDSFKTNGHHFQYLGTSPVKKWLLPKRKNVPTLVLLGKNDPSYPQPEYLNFIENHYSKIENSRVVVFEGKEEFAHDLWTRKDTKQYKTVLQTMVQFWAPTLAP